jgi:alpha-1,2-mannosyltransferase
MGELMLAMNRTEKAAFVPLTYWNKIGLVVFALVIVAFACLVEKRSAFMQRRMTDAGVYFRAAWAVRSGGDLYHIADDNDWHYNYPPLLAILMGPLADAPAGQPRDGLLPYPALVAIWFAFNLVCVLAAVHWLARALEETSPNSTTKATPWGCRAWWAHRMVPLLICLPPIAHTLMRGQVNLLLLLLLAGTLGALVRGQSSRAGMWLAGAICLKIIPAFLLLYPLWRRDWRFLAGTTSGLVVGLGAVPLIAMGPERALVCYHDLADGVLLPGLTHDGDPTRAKELTNITSTGSQSLVVVWHNTLHPDRLTRPDRADAWLRLAALAGGGVLTLLTLWAAQRSFRQPGLQQAAETYLAWGALILVMLFSSPVSHMHYQCLCVPLVMGLLVLYPPEGWKHWIWLAATSLFYAAHTLPHVPQISELRDFGLALYVGLLMWLLAVLILALARPTPAVAKELAQQRTAA